MEETNLNSEYEVIDIEAHDFGLPKIKPGNLILKQEAPASATIPASAILVNIILDQDEGVAINKGRYTTWTSFYFVHKKWLEQSENQIKLAKRFSVFAVADFQEPPFKSELLKPETAAWFEENWKKYYQLIPITNLYEKKFKTVGVKINSRTPKAVSSDDATQTVYKLPSLHNESNILLISIFGEWFTGGLFCTSEAKGVTLKHKYSEKWSQVASCIQSYLDLIGTEDTLVSEKEEASYENA